MRKLFRSIIHILCVQLFILQFIGAEWLKRSISPSTYSYLSVTWTSDSQVVAVGNNQDIGAVVFSNDGGLSWKNSNATFGALYDVDSMYVSGLSATYILAVDDLGQVWLSTNGAVTWSITTSIGLAMYGVCFGESC